MTDTIESLRAELAGAEARAEYEHAEMQRQAKLAVDWMIDAQRALAACAEMRAALERMIKYAVEDRATTPGSTRLERQITRANCLLARTDLGRGKVAVPLGLLERVRYCLRRDSYDSSPDGMKVCRDLDALLYGGKGRG